MTPPTTQSPAQQAHWAAHHRKLENMFVSAPNNQYFLATLRASQGTAELSMAVREEFHHCAGAMHGMVYFKALDDAMAFAANSVVDDVVVLTASLEIEFLRPVSTGRLRAVGRVSTNTERRIEAVGELFDEEGRLVARSKGQFARSRRVLSPSVHYE